ncbi:hypothetical protein C6499_19165 [Candidatus Poribacteria bacterium]|nr:MAG: hypothetical protein C6499_19165 [Candidatus Poribacteria bacterium]
MLIRTQDGQILNSDHIALFYSEDGVVIAIFPFLVEGCPYEVDIFASIAIDFDTQSKRAEVVRDLHAFR